MKRHTLLHLIADTLLNISTDHPLRVGIDGLDAAGKTYLADEIGPILKDSGREVVRASIDGFHNPAAIRYQKGRRSPKGYYQDSFNYTAVLELLLHPLGPEGTRCYRTRVFDHQTNSPIEEKVRMVQKNAILVMDGIFLFRPILNPFFDFRIFLQVSFKTSIKRALVRSSQANKDKMTHLYEQRYIPGQRMYFEQVQPRKLANLVIDNNVLSNPIIIKTPSRRSFL